MPEEIVHWCPGCTPTHEDNPDDARRWIEYRCTLHPLGALNGDSDDVFYGTNSTIDNSCSTWAKDNKRWCDLLHRGVDSGIS